MSKKREKQGGSFFDLWKEFKRTRPKYLVAMSDHARAGYLAKFPNGKHAEAIRQVLAHPGNNSGAAIEFRTVMRIPESRGDDDVADDSIHATGFKKLRPTVTPTPKDVEGGDEEDGESEEDTYVSVRSLRLFILFDSLSRELTAISGDFTGADRLDALRMDFARDNNLYDAHSIYMQILEAGIDMNKIYNARHGT